MTAEDKVEKLPIIGHDRTVMDALVKTLHNAARGHAEYGPIQEDQRGAHFEVRLQYGQVARVTVEMDRYRLASDDTGGTAMTDDKVMASADQEPAKPPTVLLGHIWANDYGNRIDLTGDGDEIILTVDLGPMDAIDLRLNASTVRDLRLKLIRFERTARGDFNVK